MGRLEDLDKRLDERLARLERRLDGRLADLGLTRTDRAVQAGTGDTVRSASPARRIGVCVGLNEVDAAAYPDSKMDPLSGCVADAERFLCVLKKTHFGSPDRKGTPNDGPVKLLNREATCANVFGVLAAAAGELMPGDLFVFHIAGHGGPEDWCLYDGPAWNRDILWAFSQFRPGVRILAINDQCHSGGFFQARARGGETPFALLCRKAGRPAEWNAAEAFARPDFPQLIQFAGCRAEQSTMDGIGGGSWTQSLVNVLEAALAAGGGGWPTYRKWFDNATESPTLSPGKQDPQWVESASVTDGFRRATALA